MFPSLPVSTLYHTIAIEINRILYSLYQYDLLLHSVGLVPISGHQWFYFFRFCMSPWSDWSCHTPHTSVHRPDILWVDHLNHNICRSGFLWAFWHVFVVFPLLSLPFFNCFIFLKSFVSLRLVIIMDWAFCISTLLPRLILAHLLHLNLPWFCELSNYFC